MLCISGFAHAKDLNGSFVVKGVGTLSCKELIIAARKDAPVLQQYAGYLSGYISAYNELSDETFDVLPWQHLDTVMLLLLENCKQKPESTVGGAVSRVTQFFKANKQVIKAEKTEVKGPQQSVFLYPTVVEQITNALQQKGYDTTNLWRAMAKYQQDKALLGATPFEQLIVIKLLYGS